MMSKVPTSKIHRNAIVAGTAVKLGANAVKNRTQSLLSPRGSKLNTQQTDAEQAEIIFSALGRLKGTALKAAQMLALENSLVPKAYREALNKACYRAPGLNRAVVRKVFMSQFGCPPEKLFAVFDYTPFAAASLGQVHRAEDRNGNLLAVKVQYPGIAESIHADIATLSVLLKAVPSRFQFEQMLPEIELRLMEETDYELEFQRQADFYAGCDIANLRVLPPIAAYSSKRVMSSPYVAGLHIDEWLETDPPISARNAVCQALCDLFFTSISRYGMLHADPNIGNFLIDKDNRLVVLDFGCTVPVDPDTAGAFVALLKAYKTQDIEQVIDYFNRLYMNHQGEPEKMKNNALFIEYLAWQHQLLAPASFDFSAHPSYMAQGVSLAVDAHKYSEFPVNPSKEVLFLERVYYGYLQLCQRAGACVRFEIDTLFEEQANV
ncbi:ABC1 kinase family protein [Photobacterium sp. TY1-4]|uniref:ABC1 kinase family protein n=1 Tax=Photobacterium sp. TY1-4 TaxID=2899122 RepID=UPI0021C0AA8B|nr:AarF/ABC1/UbiB kinase family protein [Photobacterium sp. TY1-4]UXI02977.1 AarF/ABC1/UbiB kinase family protein [Photobacterium sp. TY1-4]